MSDLGDDPPNPSPSPQGDDTAQELFLEAVEEENVAVRSRMSILQLTEQLARIQQQLQDAGIGVPQVQQLPKDFIVDAPQDRSTTTSNTYKCDPPRCAACFLGKQHKRP